MIICLYKGKGIVSRGIRFQTRGTYTHASILLDENHVFEAREFRGVKISEITEKDDIDYFHIDITEQQADELIQFLAKQKGKGYDYWSIWAFIARAKENRASLNLWFCSELVFAALKKIGINLLERIKAYMVDPYRLSTSPILGSNSISKDEIDKDIEYYTSFNSRLVHWLSKQPGYQQRTAESA